MSEVNTQQIVLEQTRKEYQTPDFLNFKDIIRHYNKYLTTLDAFYKKEFSMTQTLSTLTNIERPQNLYFTNLSINKTEDQHTKATITGFAKSREDVLTFQKNIESVKEITHPIFSPQSWVQSQNVTFYVTFELTNPTN